MITVIHGDNDLQIQKMFQDQKAKIKASEVITLTKPDYLTLRSTLQSPSMFFDDRAIIVENLLSQGLTAEAINLLARVDPATTCIFLERKKLDGKEKAPSGKTSEKSKKRSESLVKGKTLLTALQKQVPGILIIACNDYSLFDFLDALKPGNQKDILQRLDKLFLNGYEGEEVFYMIVDHIRNLIIARDVGPAGLASMHEFRRGKILTQSKAFDLKQLISLYQKLFQLEVAQKEKRLGEGSPFSMEEDLRFLLATTFLGGRA